jgi:hypothetical protein
LFHLPNNANVYITARFGVQLSAMKPLFPDTTPKAEAILLEGYRKMPAWEKLQCVENLNQTLKQLQLADIKAKHPNADEYELKRRLASRWIEPELMKKAFGWDVEEKGY